MKMSPLNSSKNNSHLCLQVIVTGISMMLLCLHYSVQRLYVAFAQHMFFSQHKGLQNKLPLPQHQNPPPLLLLLADCFPCIPPGLRNPIQAFWCVHRSTVWPFRGASCLPLLQPNGMLSPTCGELCPPSCRANKRQSGFSLY